MQIVHIFGNKEGFQAGEGLWAVRYEPKSGHAFHEVFGRFEDPEWMFKFCMQNLEDLQIKFGRLITVEEAALELMMEAQALKGKIVALARGWEKGKNLQHVFQPLNNTESNLQELQLSKGSIKSTINNPKLRIYAVRLDANTYVVTGGAIKLTNLMEDRPHTHEELKKMRRVKSWLKDQGICFPDDLTYLP